MKRFRFRLKLLQMEALTIMRTVISAHFWQEIDPELKSGNSTNDNSTLDVKRRRARASLAPQRSRLHWHPGTTLSQAARAAPD